MTGPWISGESLSPSRLNLHAGAATLVTGFSTDTIQGQSGLTVDVISDLSVQNTAAAQRIELGGAPSNTSGLLSLRANSAQTDYLFLQDSTGAKSNFLLGLRTGDSNFSLVDGLNIYDTSHATMIVRFSSDSVRFYPPIVAPVFDTGGALAGTYNAALYLRGGSKESQIQAAINAAAGDAIPRVYVPANLYPYSAASVSFDTRVQMVREGGNWAYHDIQAYGAAGDGTTDDTVAIRSAITSAPAGAIVFVPEPRSAFKITTDIIIDKSLTLTGYGYGSVLSLVSTGAANLLRITASNVEVSKLKLVSNGVRVGSTLSENGILVTNCNESSIHDVWIDNASIAGIQFSVGTMLRHRAFNNVITNTNTSGSQTNASDIFINTGVHEDTQIVGNYCLSTKKSCGILTQPGSGGATDAQRRLLIADNLVHTSTQQGQPTGHGIIVYVATDGATARDTVIARNTILNCDGMGVYVKGLVATPDLVTGVLVAENQLINTVRVGTAGVLPDGAISVTYALGTRIVANSIRSQIGGATTDAAIRLFDGADDTTVVGNTVREWTRDGIYLNGTIHPARCIIAQNTLNGIRQGLRIDGIDHRITHNIVMSPLFDGVRIQATATDVLVQGNRVSGAGVSGYGVDVMAGATRTHVFDNQLTGNTFPYNDAGTGTVASRNRQTTGAQSGRAVLVAGTVTVATAEVLTGDSILLTGVVAGGTPGMLNIGTITNATNFVINSTSAGDTSTIFWEIKH